MNSIKLYGTFFCLVITLYCGVKIALQPSKAEQAYNIAKAECKDKLVKAGYYNGSFKSAYMIESACSKIASK
jgi:hypothetical protein